MFGELLERAVTRRGMMRAAGAGLAGPAALAAGGSLVMAATSPGASQEASPTAGSCPGTVSLGTKVTFIAVDGTEVGKLSVDSITEPFTGYRQNNPPPRGSYFITLTVTVDNTGGQPWSFNPGSISIQDTDGFLLNPTSVDLGDTPAIPALTGQTIDAGASVTGVVGYAAIKGTTPRRIFFSPSGDRLLLLADLV